MRIAITIVVLAAFASLAFAQGQTETFTYTYSGLPIPIYPDDWNVWGIGSILVPETLIVSKVTVAVQVQYSGVGDLNVFFWSPNGTRTKLLERNCGSLVNIDTTFDDAATTKFSSFCPSEAGRGPFQGNEPLANSNGQNAFGFWRLGIENNGSGNTGFLNGFSVTITGTTLDMPVIGPRTIVSLASLQNGTLAPGDYVAIFGGNLGPALTLRADATQPLPTSLGGTTVTFDGVQVPLFSAGANLVTLQVPFSLHPGTNTQVQVATSAGTSSTVPMTVVSAKPGVLTYESEGRGQARAVNQDGTLNGDGSFINATTPAPAGTVITVYATGLGTVSPAISAGTPPSSTTLSTTDLPVTATIDGQPATVLWAGAAPTMTGVYQVNLQLPSTAPSGAQPIVLSAGGNNSQADVTIQVK